MAKSFTPVTLSDNADSYTETRAGLFRIQGKGGNDIILVAPDTDGDDILDGGSGNDRLTAAATNDLLDGGSGIDTLNGGAGDDVLRGGSSADLLNGGEGIDTADYSTSVSAVVVTLPSDPTRTARGSGGDALGDTLSSIENLTGSAFNDTLSGNRLDNRLIGGLGNDVLRGLDGNDTLFGDALVDSDGDGQPDDSDGDGVPDGADAATGGNDILDGGFGNDVLYAAGGDDTLIGGFGADSMRGGAGNDLLTAGDGDDLLDGGEGNDQLMGGAGNNTLIGGAGNDFFSSSLGNDILSGGEGDDELNAGDGANTLEGGEGNDTLLSASGTDVLNGGSGNDRLHAGGGNDVMNGDDGDDTLLGGDGADAMNGGAGIDTADYSGGGAVGINLLTNVHSGAAAGDVLTGIENLSGSALDDILAGDGADNVLTGGGGGDLLVGQGGFDTADYSSSQVGVTIQLNATAADPTIAGTGTGGDAEGDQLLLIERIVGSAFGDTFLGDELNNTFMGGLGADTLTGNGGVDTAEYSASSASVSVTLDDVLETVGIGGDAEGDRLSGIENLIGSSFADTLIGSAGANRLEGGEGDDTVRGGGGNDTLRGDAGVDTVDYSTSESGVTVVIASGFALSQTTGAGDALGDSLGGFENIVGSAFNDVLTADPLGLPTPSVTNNRLDGGAGNDTLSGGAGADTLIGGDGSDTATYSGSLSAVSVSLDALAATIGAGGDAQGDQLSGIENLIGSAFGDLLIGSTGANDLQGGSGDDTLRGGAGADAITGGAGVDTLDYSTSGAGVTVNIATGFSITQGGTATDSAGDRLSSLENLIGSAFNDTLNADVAGTTATNNRLDGGAGNDSLSGGSGDDTLIGGAGADTITGGSGIDTADYSSAQQAVIVNIASGVTVTQSGSGTDSAGDRLSSLENLIGSAFNDTLNADIALPAGTPPSVTDNLLDGGAGNDTLSGGAGNDTLLGGLGNDSLNGGNENDVLRGGAGADTLIGGAGIDTVDYSTSTAGVTIQLNSNPATLLVQGGGGEGTGDALNSIENLIGSTFSDVLRGSNGANRLVSGASGSTLEELRGGSANDVLVASAATGGQRNLYGDGLTDGGTAGVDRFEVLAGTNVIQDYQAGEDIAVNSLTSTALEQQGTSWLAHILGTTHDTFVVLGTDAAAAEAAYSTLITNDLFLDPNLIA